VRARAAVGAGLAGASLFIAGAGWMRHVVHEERMRAAELAVRDQVEEFDMVVAAVGETRPTDPLDLAIMGKLGTLSIKEPTIGFTIRDLPGYSYEVVSSDDTVLSSSPDLQAYERDGPVFPTAPRSAHRSDEAAPRSVHRGDELAAYTLRLGDPAPGIRSDLANRTHRVVVGEVYALHLGRAISFDQNKPHLRPPVALLYVLVPTADADSAVADIDRVLLPGVPVAVLLVALVAWFATDRALRPVERMRSQAAEITVTDPDRRLQVPGSRDHLARLATTFNDTLDRLAASAHRQRRFVADAAHELRSPIGSIRAILEVALAVPDSSQRDAIRAAAAEARRLHKLADDLLLLSRLEAESAAGPAGQKPVDLATLVHDQLADRGRIGPVTFVLDADADAVPPVRGTAEHLDRLLANLLDNAERHARTEVRVRLDTDPAGDVVLTVADDGPGIPAADRDRVFNRFVRLDEARDRSHGGAGLGLAIARDICERHGGTLTLAPDGVVDSTASRATGGACFVVRLRPCRPAAADARKAGA
jgi:signal transduction histidine kinase